MILRTNKMILSEYVFRVMTSDAYHTCHMIQQYTKFITQPLNLSMFIPAKLVNGKWVVLEEPKDYEYIFGVGEKPKKMIIDPQYEKDLKEYQQAVDNLVFKVFIKYFKNNLYFIGKEDKPYIVYMSDDGIEFEEAHNFKTIEDLLSKAELTDNIKQKYGI